MILDAGIAPNSDGTTHYNFFDDEIYGVDHTLQQIVEYFRSAASAARSAQAHPAPDGPGRRRQEHDRQPAEARPGAIQPHRSRARSTRSRAARCTRSRCTSCPDSIRPDIEKEYGIYIEGDLCPRCRYELEHTYGGRAEDVPVERIAFSEKERVGIGTFTPSDPKSQDISELVGGIDFSTIAEVGVESDPRAYRFDGELNIANRGVMEFVEMLKTDEKFLYVLLTLSQEQNIKTGRFSMIYADEVVVSHTNEHEYQAFVGNKRSEALQDRIILVKVPYNLRVSDEVKIYEKLLKQSTIANVHIAPYTLANRRDLRRAHAARTVQEGGHEPDEETEALRRPVRGWLSGEGRPRVAGGGGARGDGRHLAPLRHQPHLGGAGARGDRVHHADRRPPRAARRVGSAHQHHQGAARAVPQPDQRRPQGVRRDRQAGGAARLRLFLRGEREDALQQLPRQRRGVLQQDQSAWTRSPTRRASRTSG